VLHDLNRIDKHRGLATTTAALAFVAYIDNRRAREPAVVDGLVLGRGEERGRLIPR